MARAPIMPVGGMPLLHDHVRASEADRRAAARFVRRRLAAAPGGLGLEDAPAVIAGVGAQVGLLQHEPDVVAPDLLAGPAAEARVSRSDAVAHAPGQPVARQ